jgi:dCMP deaminase
MNEGKYINWEEYFMGIALLSSMRSKDPVCKVGAAIVKNNRVYSLGYNGMPKGCDDTTMPWGKDDPDPLKTKRPYVVHAELNAILNANKDLTGTTLFVTRFPCNECAKAIVQSGIVEVCYLSDKHMNDGLGIASNLILKNANIKIRKYEGKIPTIDFGDGNEI